jgi:H+/Cl- antiporter ClcA
MTIEPDAPLKISYYKLMIYAALFAALSSLLTVGYITLYNQGIKFFEQVSLIVSILLQAFISVWSGAPVGPEGPLTFLTGGFGR